MLQLEPNCIYAALTRSNLRGLFHWIIYVCETPLTGWELHATTNGDTLPWHYECVWWNGPESEIAVTFTEIGRLAPGFTMDMIDLYLKDIPMAIPPDDALREPRFTTRVWFREAIRQLHWAQLFVHCSDVDALERQLSERATAAEYMDQLPQLMTTQLAGPWSSWEYA